MTSSVEKMTQEKPSKGRERTSNPASSQLQTWLDPLPLRALRALAAREDGEIVIAPEELEIEGHIAIRRLPDGAMMVRIVKEGEP